MLSLYLSLSLSVFSSLATNLSSTRFHSQFSTCYIIQGANARKHDSHGWFFSCCRSLDPNYIMMTVRPLLATY